MEEKLSAARQVYMPVALRGSLLFFVAWRVSALQPLYHLSLDRFVGDVEKVLSDTPQTEELEKHNEALVHSITAWFVESTYTRIFHADRPVLGLVMTLELLKASGAATEAEIAILTRSHQVSDASGLPYPQEEEIPSLSRSTWLAVCFVADSLPAMASLPDAICSNLAGWAAWAGSPWGGESAAPGGWDASLTGVQRLIMEKVLRPHAFHSACQQLTSRTLGTAATAGRSLSIDEVVEKSSSTMPCLLLSARCLAVRR